MKYLLAFTIIMLLLLSACAPGYGYGFSADPADPYVQRAAADGAIQATEAMKLVVAREDVNRDLILIDVWRDVFDHIKVEPRENCPACQGRYEFLEKKFTEKVNSLCGQSRSVQVLDVRVGSVDLRKLAAFLYEEHPDVLAAARSKETKIQELASGAVRTLTSINAFSGRPEFLGGKTGYTDEAGGNLVSIFSYLHRPVFIVVLGTEDRFGETEKLFEWLKKSYAR